MLRCCLAVLFAALAAAEQECDELHADCPARGASQIQIKTMNDSVIVPEDPSALSLADVMLEQGPRGRCDPATFCTEGEYDGEMTLWGERTCDHVLSKEGGWVCSPNPKHKGGQDYAKMKCCGLGVCQPDQICGPKKSFQSYVVVWPGESGKPDRTCGHVAENEGGWACKANPSAEEVGGQRYVKHKCCKGDDDDDSMYDDDDDDDGNDDDDDDDSSYGDGDGPCADKTLPAEAPVADCAEAKAKGLCGHRKAAAFCPVTCKKGCAAKGK